MCCFITPQIKFGNPASAVMYYKAQMGGRERKRMRQGERGEQPGKEAEELSWLRGCQCLWVRELNIAEQQGERGTVSYVSATVTQECGGISWSTALITSEGPKTSPTLSSVQVQVHFLIALMFSHQMLVCVSLRLVLHFHLLLALYTQLYQKRSNQLKCLAVHSWLTNKGILFLKTTAWC